MKAFAGLPKTVNIGVSRSYTYPPYVMPCVQEGIETCEKGQAGISLDILQFILSVLHYEAQFIYFNGITTEQEHYEQIALGHVDTWLFPDFLTEHAQKHFAPTTSLFSVEPSFVIKATPTVNYFAESGNIFSLGRPLTTPVWICSFFVWFVIVVATFVSFQFVQRQRRTSIRAAGQDLMRSVWFVTAAGLQQQDRRAEHIVSTSIHVFLFIWGTFAFIMQDLYGNLVTSALVRQPVLEWPFSSIVELASLIESGQYRFAAKSNSTNFLTAVYSSAVEPYRSMKRAFINSEPPILLDNKTENELDILMNAKPPLAFYGTEVSLDKLIRNSHCTLTRIPMSDLSRYHYVIVFAKGSKLAKEFSRVIHNMPMFIATIVQSYLSEGCPLNKQHFGSPPVKIQHFASIMSFLGVGLTIGSILFAIELFRKLIH